MKNIICTMLAIYDNIAFGPRTHGVRSKSKLDDIIERSLRNAAIWDELKDRLKKDALGLSGGQQQRLCIARALAQAVMKMDDEIDDLFNVVKRELIAQIHLDAATGEQAIDLLMIAKYYERIGDHAQNIAEWVEFALTGRHKGVWLT